MMTSTNPVECAGGDSTLRQFIGYDMKRAFNAIQADLNATLSPLGLRMVTYSVLTVVCDNPGIRQSKLAQVLSIERPNLVLILDELERTEVLERVRAPDDRRAYELSPTLKGRRLSDRATQAVTQHDTLICRGIDPEALTILHSALRQIERNGRSEASERTANEPVSVSRA